MFLKIYKKLTKPFWGSGISKYGFVYKTHHFFTRILKPEYIELYGNTYFLDKNDDRGISTTPQNQLNEIKFFEKIIQPGDTVFDVGANIGYYTLIFAKLVGKHGKVYSFEPLPENFALLKKNVEVNGYDNVILENKAVSDKIDSVYLEVAKRCSENKIVKQKTDNTIQVPTITIDSYFNSKIDFIKIDAEGYDLKVISGMEQILKKFSPKIMAEFYPQLIKEAGISPQNSLNQLAVNGYEFFDEDDKKISIEKILQANDAMDFFCYKPLHPN